MMLKNIFLVFLLIFSLFGFANAGVFNITSTTGETWITWNWSVPDNHLDQNNQMVVRVDGIIVSNESLITNGSYLTTYYLTPFSGDASSNERHVLDVSEYSNTSVLLYSDNSIEITRQSSFYYYLVFIVSILLMIFAYIIRNKIHSIILSTASILLFAYMAMVHINFNSSFTIVNILFSVVAGYITIYSLYGLVMPALSWDSD
jgi:hypothetical protein